MLLRQGKRLTIDEGLIAARRQELANQRASTRYTKQKSALECELEQFLGGWASQKTLASALPGDVIEFLVWKDHAGRTKVHKSECQVLVSPDTGCTCPKRLAHGTMDSLIGKLRAIFVEKGRVSEWHALLGVGNPAVCRSVRAYLSDVREEQLKARITPLGDLAVIAVHIEHLLNDSANLSAIQIFTYARDQALFNSLLFTPLRFPGSGFRSGAAVSLALEGVSLHEIMDHVWWKSNKTALHYIKLRQVVNPAGAAAKLADLPRDTGETYRRVNRLEGFVPAFGN